MDVRQHLAGVDAMRLRPVVRAALAEPQAEVGAWDATLLHGGFGALAGASWLARLTGVARVGARTLPWNVVLKVIAPVAGQDTPTNIRYWRRERLLYGSGLLDDLPAGLRAPRCYGCDDAADGTAWLWLEHIQEDGDRVWSIARWGRAARHLGQFNGAYLAGRPLPQAPWLGGRRLRTWLEGHTTLVAQIVAAPHDLAVRHYWPPSLVERIVRLWDERAVFCDALERLPQTLCHGDAIRRNLLSRQAPDGTEETVGIDWEFVGAMAAGEEIGQTLSVASAFFQLEPAELPALDDALLTGYLAGLREAGWRGDERQVRFAQMAHAALRNLFNAVGTRVPDEARRPLILQSQGRTWEELAERRAAIRPFLLACADEARHLL